MAMKLTKDFTLEELIQSGAAEAAAIKNIPTNAEALNLTALAENILQPIRDHFKRPVTITSGYRCQKLNRLIGGQPDSQHMKGQAADIKIAGVKNSDIYQFIFNNLRFDQVIAEQLYKKDGSAGWVHVSYSPAHRKEGLSYLGRGHGYIQGLHFIDE
jgi:zinc D-Ala-D-Ala carboxypeptidase